MTHSGDPLPYHRNRNLFKFTDEDVVECGAQTNCIAGPVTCSLPKGHDGHHRGWYGVRESFTWNPALVDTFTPEDAVTEDTVFPPTIEFIIPDPERHAATIVLSDGRRGTIRVEWEEPSE